MKGLTKLKETIVDLKTQENFIPKILAKLKMFDNHFETEEDLPNMEKIIKKHMI